MTIIEKSYYFGLKWGPPPFAWMFVHDFLRLRVGEIDERHHARVFYAK